MRTRSFNKIGAHSSESDSSQLGRLATFSDGLPRSVRGQAPDMRLAIRRRQSSESARRRREREKQEMDFMERKYAENKDRMDKLEMTIDALANELTFKR